MSEEHQEQGKPRNATILGMEERLDYLVENDPENEEIYKII